MGRHTARNIVIVLFILIILFFLVPISSFSVNGTGAMQGAGGPYGLTPTTVTLSGFRALSCSVLGIGILRVSNVSGAEIGGLSLNAELMFTGWSNYCDNNGISSGAYLPKPSS